tara:strand:+ start:3035 stop:3274 length:240 start_codon:yes stop_codon:yes gene_type:complete
MDINSILNFIVGLQIKIEQRDLILQRFSPGDCKQVNDTIHLGNIAEKTLHFIMFDVKGCFDDAEMALACNEYLNPAFIQ